MICIDFPFRLRPPPGPTIPRCSQRWNSAGSRGWWRDQRTGRGEGVQANGGRRRRGRAARPARRASGQGRTADRQAGDDGGRDRGRQEIAGQAAMARSEAGSASNRWSSPQPSFPLMTAPRSCNRRSAPRRDRRFCHDLVMRGRKRPDQTTAVAEAGSAEGETPDNQSTPSAITSTVSSRTPAHGARRSTTIHYSSQRHRNGSPGGSDRPGASGMCLRSALPS